MIKHLAILAACVLTLSATGFGQAAGMVRVVFETEKGVIAIDVDVTHAPVSAANFLKYVDGGFFDGGQFHRTVRPDTETNKANPIQVIQARSSPARRDGFPAIPLERTSVTGLKHLDGTVSMARSGVDSATSDFFICVGDQPSLDFGGARNSDGQGFAAFGRVVSGMDVVKAIQAAPVSKLGPGGGNGAGSGGVENTQSLMPPIAVIKAHRRSGPNPNVPQ